MNQSKLTFPEKIKKKENLLSSEAPLILCAWMDDLTQTWLNDLRTRHFPPHLNRLSAHLTLFHALRGENRTSIEEEINQVLYQHLPKEGESEGSATLQFPKLISLGRGFAAEVVCAPLVKIHRALQGKWWNDLTPQDRQGFRPHVTLQNKVSPVSAQNTLQQLAPNWRADHTGTLQGLTLWVYQESSGTWSDPRYFPKKFFTI